MTVTDDLRLRSKPEVSDAATIRGTLAWGTRLAIEAGPVAGSGYWWGQMRLLGQRSQGGAEEGWIALGTADGTPWIVVGDAAILVALRERIVGSWAGTMRSEWVAPYGVSLVFRADGKYTSHAAPNATQPALYWGSDTDSPVKTYAIRDVAADGTASGDIVLYFDLTKGTMINELRDIAFQGDRLTFTLWHSGASSPISLDLTRSR